MRIHAIADVERLHGGESRIRHFRSDFDFAISAFRCGCRVRNARHLYHPLIWYVNLIIPTKFAEYARQLGVELVVVEASKPDQYEAAFEAALNQGAKAIFVMPDPLTFIHSAKINEIAARYHLPAMAGFVGLPKFVQDGWLMSYGANQGDNWPRAADYVAKILKGEKPGGLPVQQPTEYDLFLNLKTAKTLGITFPPSILAQAKEVIE
jgi:putative ABC transport system substrate-binding protein